ncbi:MAG TPA: hypothetical protein VN656_02735 [Stellaceae bacterium]|nr:hypothetical protein [Stellaceae bacterium]
MRESLQELARLLAQYRRRLDRGDNLHPAELLRALIAEIESPGDREPPKDMRAGRGC